MKCPRCQQDNPSHAKFCPECGTPLTRTGPQAALYTDLQRALSEALERQTATSEILRVISSSPTDVQPVFDVIVESAVRLCDALFGTVLRFDGQRIDLAAHHNLPPEGLQAYENVYPMSISRDTVAGNAILDRRVINVIDSQDETAVPWRSAAMARAVGFRGILVVPMLREGQPIGVINVARREPGPFSDRQIELLQTFADQAVIAIENVRLFNETKEALEQQTATAEILRVISSSPTDLQPVMNVLAENAARLCEAVDAAIHRVEGNVLGIAANYVAIPGLAPLPVALLPIDRTTVTGRAVVDWLPVHVHDLAEADEAEFPVGRESARRLGHRTTLAVPLLREGAAIGAILIRRREVNPFSDKQIALLKTFADQAVIAIENVRLFRELEERNGALSEALEQQTATSEVLRVIAGSPTDLQLVLDTVAASAARLCEATNAQIFHFDSDVLKLAANYGDFPAIQERPVSRGSVIGRAFIDRQTTHVHDLAAEVETEYPDTKDPQQRFGQRTVLATPLLRKGIPIGVVVIRRIEVRPFTDKQIALLKTFADQAVIAIENVRLFTELQEKNRALTDAHAQVTQALERQTATADILRIISRSQTDIQPVFDTIADSALRLLKGWSALILLYDGELLHFGAARGGLPDSERYQRERFPMRPHPDLLVGRCILERAPQQDPDARANPIFRDLARRRGFAAVLTVPMLRGGEAIGEVVVTRAKAGPFEESEIALLQTFADQTVIAIENARLLSELQARTQELTRSVEHLTALGEVGRTLSSTLDLDTVLQTIVTRASELAGTDACSVFEYDEASEAFHLRATYNLEDEVVALARRTPTRKGEGVQGRMAVTRQPVQIPDIAVEDAYRGPLRDVLLRTGTRAVLAIPMLREDQLIGGLTVNKKTPGEFSPEVIELLKIFATQSALAIQNARLFREIADKSRQLEVASQHKSEFLANMSHELRTPLNAILGFSEALTERMFGDLNEKQEEYLRDIYASGQHLLSLINDILDLAKIEAGRMELELTEFDLPQAITDALTLVRERAGRRGIALHEAVDRRLGQIRGDERKIKQALLNLLSNAVKFTPEGGRVDVRASVVDGMAEISVTDTGVGIAPEDQEAVFEEFRQVGTAAKRVEGTGLGLALSRKFIELHGGRIWVKSQIGVGSTFTFTLPLAPA